LFNRYRPRNSAVTYFQDTRTQRANAPAICQACPEFRGSGTIRKSTSNGDSAIHSNPAAPGAANNRQGQYHLRIQPNCRTTSLEKWSVVADLVLITESKSSDPYTPPNATAKLS